MLLNEKRFTITMKELFLIRHGEAEHQVRGMTGGWTDTKLTELGKKQALKTSQKLKVTLKNKNFQIWWLKLPEEAKFSFEFSNCSITELNINDWGERTIVKLNDTSHLVNLELLE